MSVPVVRVTDDCWIQTLPEYGYALIGNDMSMNGIDSPAMLRTQVEIDALIAALKLLKREPWCKP